MHAHRHRKDGYCCPVDKTLLSKGRARRVLVLEPTRFLVEQTSRVLRSFGIDAAAVHGSISRGVRRARWRKRVVVATPEIVVSEGFREFGEPDAIVVDECHHTTGQDPYVEVAKRYKPFWRLGLTAFIPPSRRRMLEEYIGEARCWSWEDPRIRKFIPEWAGEVYEAPLNAHESRLYTSLERIWSESTGLKKVIVGNAIRWFVRDGAEALRETVSRSDRMRMALENLLPLIFSRYVRPAHKLPALRRVLSDHEGFSKAVVFVDRIAIARIIAAETREYNPVLMLGRRHVDPAAVLAKARREETRLIVATSAGEEGIDLPEVDLLIVWSNTASPLRFIQRLGRLLRAGPRRRIKTAVFIATPDTVDIDSLIDGIVLAERHGVRMGISPDVVRYLMEMSRHRRILEVIEDTPLPPDLVARAVDLPLKRVEDSLKWLVRHGYAVYIYTPFGKVYGPRSDIQAFYRVHKDYLTPNTSLEATVVLKAGKTQEQ